MKKSLLTLSILTAALLLTACASDTDMATATNSPDPSPTVTFPDMMPETTDMMPDLEGMVDNAGDMVQDTIRLPDTTSIPESTGVTSMETARRSIEQIEDELERLSEVDDAQVVIAGSKAAVALDFDDQYRSGIDDRLRGIVRDRIDSVISGVSTVAITADPTIMDTLEALGDRLTAMSDMTALQSELDNIIRQINAQS